MIRNGKAKSHTKKNTNTILAVFSLEILYRLFNNKYTYLQ